MSEKTQENSTREVVWYLGHGTIHTAGHSVAKEAMTLGKSRYRLAHLLYSIAVSRTQQRHRYFVYDPSHYSYICINCPSQYALGTADRRNRLPTRDRFVG